MTTGQRQQVLLRERKIENRLPRPEKIDINFRSPAPKAEGLYDLMQILKKEVKTYGN